MRFAKSKHIKYAIQDKKLNNQLKYTMFRCPRHKLSTVTR